MLSVKQKIAKKLGIPAEQVQIGLSERWLDTADNNKLIYQMGFSDRQLIIVKTHTVVSSYSSKVSEVRQPLQLQLNYQLAIVATSLLLLCRLRRAMHSARPWLWNKKSVFPELLWRAGRSCLSVLSSCVVWVAPGSSMESVTSSCSYQPTAPSAMWWKCSLTRRRGELQRTLTPPSHPRPC